MTDRTITQISWGHFYLDGGSMFGIVPRTIWARLIEPNESNGVRMALRSLLLRRGDHIVLVDCGIWPCFPEKLRDVVYRVSQRVARETFREQTGLAPEQVTDIVATHLHFDHVGGLAVETDGTLVPAFPAARVHVQKSQLEWAVAPSVKDRGSYIPRLVEFVAGLPGLVAHEGPYRLDEGIHVDVSSGHTPGMQIVRAEVGGQHFIHAADMVPTSAHVPLPYVMAFDLEPLRTVAEKESLFSSRQDAVYFFQHDPEHPFWKVEKTEKGWQRGAKWADAT